MIKIPAGKYSIGNNRLESHYSDNETKVAQVITPSFLIDDTTVTNTEFERFIQATNYQTDAELLGSSFVFYQLIEETDRPLYQAVTQMPWWLIVPGANWQQPEGPASSIAQRKNHPVVHVSRRDAAAYCQWSGKRLPTEVEWEIAAKGDSNHQDYPWGETVLLNQQHMSNIWQGDFPTHNTLEDGYLATAPVKTYEPNGYGCYQMIGNVWEWCANEAYIDIEYFRFKSGAEIWQEAVLTNETLFALKGGSFLCHPTYCDRNRISARNGNKALSTASNIGFRCVKGSQDGDE